MFEFFIASAANIISTSLCQPIDVIKTNYQLKNTSLKETIKNIYKTKQFRGFYSGLNANIYTFPLFWGIYFQSNELIKKTNYNPFGVYFLSGIVASTITNPLFVIKTRLQSGAAAQNKYIYQIGLNIYNNEGFGALFKGLNASILNNIKLGIQFPLNNYFRDSFQMSIVQSAFFSKLISTALFYPLDLIRVHQRNATGNIGLLHVVRHIYGTGGPPAFYRGVLIYISISTPNFVIMMYIINKLKKIQT